MDFIQTANKQVDKFGAGKHGFSAGNPSGGIPATNLSPEWCDNIQQELVNVIEGAGITINPASKTQLAQAIQAMISGATGNDYKASVRVATTANIASLAGGAPNTVDGISLAVNNRILVKDQSTGSQNGIYVVATVGTGANGTWARALDADAAGELTAGSLVSVEEGISQADSLWMLTTDEQITIGATALVFIRKDAVSGDVNAKPEVRQTVLSGPLDSNGLPNFGGSTGGTTVTASGTIKATAANALSDRTGTIVNPSWTGVTTNSWATLSIDSSGVCTPNVRTLEPVYQWGGTPSVVNGQLTFNIQEMKMYLGNGTVANEVYEVVVGQFTAAGTVSAIAWYALRGRYESPAQSIPANSTLLSVNHNLGVMPSSFSARLRCVIAEHGYPVGSEATFTNNDDGDGGRASGSYATKLAAGWMNSSTSPTPFIKAMSAGGMATLTAANWRLVFYAYRGW